MTTGTGVDAAIAGAQNDFSHKSNLLFRTFVFVSLHLAFVGAGLLLYAN